MSIYKKFIDSAATNMTEFSASNRQQHQQQANGMSEPVTTRTMRRHKSRALDSIELSPIASVMSSNLSSTPINANSTSNQQVHFKQSVNSNGFLSNSSNSNHEHQHSSHNHNNHHHYHNHHHHLPSSHHHHQHNPSHYEQQENHYSHSHRHQHHGHSSRAELKQQLHQQQQQQQNYQNLRLPPVASLPPCRAQTAKSHVIVLQDEHNLRPVLVPNVEANSPKASLYSKHNPYNTNDPVLLEWLKSMRFQPELECLTALQARTLAVDENAAGALSVRNSQVAIQEMRLESDFILNLADCLIEMLPVTFSTIDKLAIDFSDLWSRLVNQTAAKSTTQQQPNTLYSNGYQNNNLTIINCTPRKSLVSAGTLRPLDKLAIDIRNVCIEVANLINSYQENYNSHEHIDNSNFEARLRKIKELYGKFVDMSIRIECANIVRALDYDFKKSSVASLAASAIGAGKLPSCDSGASLRPVRPYEASSATLPLKWALIALWQLTKDDAYICRTLTEKWQTSCNSGLSDQNASQQLRMPSRVAKRLDYSTTSEQQQQQQQAGEENSNSGGILPEFEKIYKICPNPSVLQEERQAFLNRRNNTENRTTSGALKSALKSKQQQPTKQVSTIELLIDIIINQPNRHERLDMLNFVQNSRLVDVDELDQSMSAAFYTSNQYKVAALRILNHLCINEQAIKTILKCFSTPPPKQGHPLPENRIIKSIFECYQTAQEHIYQNEQIFNINRTPSRRCRKRARQVQDIDCDEYSDYGSRQTNSVPTSESINGAAPMDSADDDGDDAVVKEAIRLVMQLTTPFHRSNQGHDYYTLIGRFSIESLVKYLTNIIKSTPSRDMVLLSLSALANISFITTEPMKLLGTNRIILEMFSACKSRSKDLELRDQAVTILANTADKNFIDIVNNGGLKFLLSCLEICPTRMSNYKLLHDRLGSESLDPYSRIDTDSDTYSMNSRKYNIDNKPRDRKPIQMSDEFIEDLDCACDNEQQINNLPTMCLSRLTPAELAAMERIHQKTAVAFARLSVDPSTTKMVLRYGGVKQMIDLCKLSHRRNHSDTVLIACLAALRKIAKVIGGETFRHYNALDLIELELNQAMEIYGRLYASEV